MVKRKKDQIVCILNGPPGSGKTTLADFIKKMDQKFVERVSVDTIRKSLVKTRNFETKRGRELLFLSTLIAAAHVHSIFEKKSKRGKLVIIDDCIVELERLKFYKLLLHGYKLILVLLWPNIKVQRKRDSSRNKKEMLSNQAIDLRNKMNKSNNFFNEHDIVLDNSTISIEKTFEKFLKEIMVKK